MGFFGGVFHHMFLDVFFKHLGCVLFGGLSFL